ncbi:hypothetical protein UO65_0470 [Actinokineospora spheciospongiae]|uniref:Uncharacterized protein n=1 Tax=Actinokineospora spheciospongiae TaxID=909613 RepID=W7JDR2_9PSEU|nr:hypothetical protein UO65_0470 [Actinokineospora spheciospongiae]
MPTPPRRVGPPARRPPPSQRGGGAAQARSGVVPPWVHLAGAGEVPRAGA